MTVITHEWKLNYKTLIIWLVAIAALGGGCMFLYPLMGDSMTGMDEIFSSMGAFTQAFGLDKLSMATANGFFATEVGTIYALGGGMFAALLGIGLLSKEEGGHTSEFLYTLPLGRLSIFFQKYIAMISMLIIFGLVNYGVFIGSFLGIGEPIPWKILSIYMLLQFLLQLELSTICYLISSLNKRIQVGLGIGLALVFYLLDIFSRITDEISGLKYITPFYYSNASSIFTNNGHVDMCLVGISLGITVICITVSAILFNKKDLSS